MKRFILCIIFLMNISIVAMEEDYYNVCNNDSHNILGTLNAITDFYNNAGDKNKQFVEEEKIVDFIEKEIIPQVNTERLLLSLAHGIQRNEKQVLPCIRKKIENITSKVQFYKAASQANLPDYKKVHAQELLNLGVSPNFLFENYSRPLSQTYYGLLHDAVLEEDQFFVDYLIGRGADVNIAMKKLNNGDNNLRITPLFLAIRQNKPLLALHLLTIHAAQAIPLCQEGGLSYEIPLMKFDYESYATLFKVLVNKGLNLNLLLSSRLPNGVTIRYPLLTFAIRGKNSELIQFLLDHGANPGQIYLVSSVNQNVSTPLQDAHITRDKKIISLLENSFLYQNNQNADTLTK